MEKKKSIFLSGLAFLSLVFTMSCANPGAPTLVTDNGVGSVSCLNVTEYTKTTITVEWNAVTSADKYVLSISGGSYVEPKVIELNSDTLSYKFTGLTASTIYKISIKAKVGEEFSKTETTNTTNTKKASEVKSIDVDLAKDVTSNSIKIKITRSLSEVADRVTGYRIKVFKNGLKSPVQENIVLVKDLSTEVGLSSFEYKIENLDSDTSYSICVTSMVGENEGEDSVIIISTEIAIDPNLAAPVTDLELDGVATENTVSLKWKLPVSSKNITRFKVEVFDNDGKSVDGLTGCDVTSNQTTTTIGNLKPGINYTFKVYSMKGEEKGNYASVGALTKEAVS